MKTISMEKNDSQIAKLVLIAKKRTKIVNRNLKLSLMPHLWCLQVLTVTLPLAIMEMRQFHAPKVNRKLEIFLLKKYLRILVEVFKVFKTFE